MRHAPHINESSLILCWILGEGTHTPNTHNHTHSFVLSLSLSLSDTHTHTHTYTHTQTHIDIGEGVQGSRHVATPDCHIQNSHDVGAPAALQQQIEV